MLLPMQEKTYRRLLMLQNALNTMLPHHAGLNPKAFRCVSAHSALVTYCDFLVFQLAIMFDGTDSFVCWVQNAAR